MRTLPYAIAGTALVLSALTLSTAGPLTPPAGSVAPTYKTLTEVEPRIAISDTNTPGDANSLFRIAAPGSYYLTGNIAGVTGKSGIEIAADNVTVDLMGFTLQGNLNGSLQGIANDGTHKNIAIRNGIVDGWGQQGIDLSLNIASGFPLGCIVENVQASNNTLGIVVGYGSVIRNCVAASNRNIGISANPSTTIESCIAYDNGATGISASAGAVVTDCSCYTNGSDGLRVLGVSTVKGCACLSNAGSGILLANGQCVVTDCACSSNTANGIILQWPGSTVRGCTCNNNGGTGAGSGIYLQLASVSDCRIEGNNCAGNDFGIRIISAGNVITRNTCSGNATNWSIAANNIYGPIIDRTAPASAAVSGNSAASTLGSTDANANYTY